MVEMYALARTECRQSIEAKANLASFPLVSNHCKPDRGRLRRRGRATWWHRSSRLNLARAFGAVGSEVETIRAALGVDRDPTAHMDDVQLALREDQHATRASNCHRAELQHVGHLVIP